jgi:hypothetical protein
MAENVGDLKVTIRMIVDNPSFKKGKDAVRGIGKSTTNLTTQMNKMGKALNGIGFSFRRLILYYGGYKGIKSMVTTINTFEQLKQQLITVEQDSTKAEMSWRKLMDFATTTPFTLDKIIAGFVRLRAVGLEPTDQQMTDLGNMASAFSMNFDDVAFAVQRAISGVSRPLKKFIPLVKIAGNQISLGFNKDEMITIERDPKKLLETIAEISRVRFGGGMERQLKTIGGQWSLVIDNASKFMYLIGTSGLSGAMVEFSKTLTEGIGEGDSLAKTLGNVLGGAVRGLTATLKLAQKYAWLLVAAFTAMVAAKIRLGLLYLGTKIVSLNAKILAASKSSWLLSAALTRGVSLSMKGAMASTLAFAKALAILTARMLMAAAPILAIIALTILFLFAMDDIAAFIGGRESLIGDWFRDNFSEAALYIKFAMLMLSSFYDLLEAGADIIIWVGEKVDLFTDALANFLAATIEAFNELVKLFGLTPPKWISDPINFVKGNIDQALVAGPTMFAQSARREVAKGEQIRREVVTRKTYSGAERLTRMAASPLYSSSLAGPDNFASQAASFQHGIAQKRGMATGIQQPGYNPSAGPNVFNINVNGAEKSNEEVGKEIGKQVARDLQGRKQ